MTSAGTPADRSSSSVKNEMHSLPAARFSQNSSVFLAPGRRHDMPMMAISVPCKSSATRLTPAVGNALSFLHTLLHRRKPGLGPRLTAGMGVPFALLADVFSQRTHGRMLEHLNQGHLPPKSFRELPLNFDHEK